MNITVTLLDGTRHLMTVSPQDTVRSLKTRIHAELGVPVQKQKLVYDNGQRTTLSEDSRPVSSYGLRSGSQLTLLITQPPTIQVFLRNDKGTVSTYDIKAEETVADFKAKVESREGVPVSQQRLLHQSREMGTGKLSDYGVKEMSTIDLMLRLRGG